MGRGSYYGASTVVGPRGWSSLDPAETKGSVSRIKLRSKVSAKAMKVLAAVKKLKRPKSQVALDHKALRLVFLRGVIASQLSGLNLPGLPKDIKLLLSPAVAEAGGPVAWARAQPEYEDFLRLRIKKTRPQVQQVARPSARPEAQLALGNKIVDDLRNSSCSTLQLDQLLWKRSKLSAAFDEATFSALKLAAEIAQLDAEIGFVKRHLSV